MTSFPVRERGLKRNEVISVFDQKFVVPRAGTWIETAVFLIDPSDRYVVPRAGTWIETYKNDGQMINTDGRSPCGNVD